MTSARCSTCAMLVTLDVDGTAHVHHRPVVGVCHGSGKAPMPGSTVEPEKKPEPFHPVRLTTFHEPDLSRFVGSPPYPDARTDRFRAVGMVGHVGRSKTALAAALAALPQRRMGTPEPGSVLADVFADFGRIFGAPRPAPRDDLDDQDDADLEAWLGDRP